MTTEENDYGDLEIGPLLKRLRGQTSLREVQRLTGISSSYLSQIEKEKVRPGTDVLKRLANLYGVPFRHLMQAGRPPGGRGGAQRGRNRRGGAGLPVRHFRPCLSGGHPAPRPSLN